MVILCLQNENSSDVRGVSTTPLHPGLQLMPPALSLPKKKAPIDGAGDGDVFIESAQVGFEQMSNIADRVTDLCRDGVIRVHRQ